MDVPKQVDKAACVVCGVRATHMARDKMFQLRSVCTKHCGCCGDSTFLLRESWPAWDGNPPPLPPGLPEYWNGELRKNPAVVEPVHGVADDVVVDEAKEARKLLGRRGSVTGPRVDGFINGENGEQLPVSFDGARRILDDAIDALQAPKLAPPADPTKRKPGRPKKKGGEANG